MTVSPLMQAGWSGRFATVGTGFNPAVKRARRVGTEVLICVLPSEGPRCKITEMQAAKEFSCSQHIRRKATERSEAVRAL
jgi:hypothetical protein